MSTISKDYIVSIVNNIASGNNLSDCKYTEKNFENIAQNFFGVLIPIALKAKYNDETINIELVLKLAPTDERYRVSGAVTLMFAREIYVYTTLLEKYSLIQQNFTTNLQHLMPKCYYICKEYCKEAIAMENMCANGYEPFTHTKFLDYDHTVLSLEALAKFHALSFVLQKTDLDTFKEVEKICVPFTQETNNRFMVILLDRLQKVIRTFENDTKYLGLLKYLEEHCKKFVEAAAYSVKQKCICHGDIWKENILYKYAEDRTPIAACLIDYQTVRISSAAFDTLFLITTSTNKSLRGNSKDTFYKFLDIYYNIFTNVLCAAGFEVEDVYPRMMFDEDLKTVAPACFIIANTAIWLSSGLQEEGHVRSKQVFTTAIEREEAVKIYKSRIKDIIEDYISYGYFNPLERY